MGTYQDVVLDCYLKQVNIAGEILTLKIDDDACCAWHITGDIGTTT